MTMESDRNFVGIAISMESSDGQALQDFMSNSLWSGQGVFEQIREEIFEKPEVYTGSVLILDEYADEKAGEESAGTYRQYNGRMGKVDLCQVAVALGYANWKMEPWPLWMMVDAEIFLPEAWFGAGYAALRHKVSVPVERTSFETKPELGLKMIRRAQAAKLPFEAVLCDSLYGRSSPFRHELCEEPLLYMADIPNNLWVYPEQPMLGIPNPKPGKKGRKAEKPQVLNGVRSYSVKQIDLAEDTHWQRLAFVPTNAACWKIVLRSAGYGCGTIKNPTLHPIRNGWPCASRATATEPTPSAMPLKMLRCNPWPNCCVAVTSSNE
jgi:SRSO17 transposase